MPGQPGLRQYNGCLHIREHEPWIKTFQPFIPYNKGDWSDSFLKCQLFFLESATNFNIGTSLKHFHIFPKSLYLKLSRSDFQDAKACRRFKAFDIKQKDSFLISYWLTDHDWPNDRLTNRLIGLKRDICHTMLMIDWQTDWPNQPLDWLICGMNDWLIDRSSRSVQWLTDSLDWSTDWFVCHLECYFQRNCGRT